MLLSRQDVCLIGNLESKFLKICQHIFFDPSRNSSNILYFPWEFACWLSYAGLAEILGVGKGSRRPGVVGEFPTSSTVAEIHTKKLAIRCDVEK